MPTDEAAYSPTTTIMDSFSSTASNNPPATEPPLPTAPALAAAYLAPSRTYTYLPNTQLYDAWAPTYDSDGNVLQALDSLHLSRGLLARFLAAVSSAAPHADVLRIIDLGAGTGRASLLLIDALRNAGGPLAKRKVELRCLEVSEGMLALAQRKVGAAIQASDLSISATFEVYDLYHPPPNQAPAHGLLSTLVLEHIPLATFFTLGLAPLLQPGGIALVTNMHEDMGRTPLSQPSTHGEGEQGKAETPTGAGFNASASHKVRAAVDFAHTVSDTLAEGRRAGFELVQDEDEGDNPVVGEVKEGMVGEGGLGSRAGKWVGVKCWVGFLFGVGR